MYDVIVPYKQREDWKEEAWDCFWASETPNGKASFLLRVIECHYWRAREDIEERNNKKACLKKVAKQKYTPGYELDIDDYTGNWLWSHRNREFMSGGVFDALLEWYEPRESKYLPEGCSVYQF